MFDIWEIVNSKRTLESNRLLYSLRVRIMVEDDEKAVPFLINCFIDGFIVFYLVFELCTSIF